jgi:DNA-binding NarL/FixJ family response regulator
LSRPATRSSDILSPRQREVAALVAAGLVNREIGAVLRIGERTVESHVEAILRKLGFRRRTQIARWEGERNWGGGGQPPYN